MKTIKLVIILTSWIMIFTFIGCKKVEKNEFLMILIKDNLNESLNENVDSNNNNNNETLNYLKNVANNYYIDIVNPFYLPIKKKKYDINITYLFDEKYCNYKNENQLNFIKDGSTFIKVILKKDNVSYDFYIDLEINNLKLKSMIINNLKINYSFIKNNTIKIGPSFTSNPTKIVFHNTANTASAYNEVKYLDSFYNHSTTSYHFAVDELEVWQAIPLTNIGYHSGDYYVNKESIGVEIARSLSTSTKIKDLAIKNGAILINRLKNYYDIPKDNILTHYEVSKKFCPHDILSRYGLDNFMNLIY